MQFTSKSNHPLSKLWIMLNQLNHQVLYAPKLLSPYPQDGKINPYTAMKQVYGQCKISKFENSQVQFLEEVLQKLDPIMKDVPDYEDSFFWGLEYEVYHVKREQFKDILLQAHKEAPILE